MKEETNIRDGAEAFGIVARRVIEKMRGAYDTRAPQVHVSGGNPRGNSADALAGTRKPSESDVVMGEAEQMTVAAIFDEFTQGQSSHSPETANFALAGEVQSGERAMDFPRFFIVRAGCVGLILENAEVALAAWKQYLGNPPVPITRNAFELAGSALRPDIPAILCASANPKVGTPVIERIAVDVVNDHSRRRLHQQVTERHLLAGSTVQRPHSFVSSKNRALESVSYKQCNIGLIEFKPIHPFGASATRFVIIGQLGTRAKVSVGPLAFVDTFHVARGAPRVLGFTCAGLATVGDHLAPPFMEGCQSEQDGDEIGPRDGHLAGPPPAGLLVPPASVTVGMREPTGDEDGVEPRRTRRHGRLSAANVRDTSDRNRAGRNTAPAGTGWFGRVPCGHGEVDGGVVL